MHYRQVRHAAERVYCSDRRPTYEQLAEVQERIVADQALQLALQLAQAAQRLDVHLCAVWPPTSLSHPVR